MESWCQRTLTLGKYTVTIFLGFFCTLLVEPIRCVDERFLWKPNSEVVIQGVGNGIEWFTRNETRPNHYRILMVQGDNMMVAARNHFYNISMISLQENMHSEWNASSSAVNSCTIRDKPENCQNYIRVIALNETNLFVCGTNAFKPICRSYDIEHGSYVTRYEYNGVGKCPFDPKHNSTAILVDKHLFTATVTDTSGRDPLIFREMIRTEQHDSRWLNEPDFVSSFEYGDKVYFIYREAAVENINCGKVVFSRIARVCKADQGGLRSLGGIWTTFYKARLNCSIPGEFPFYFNEVEHATNVLSGNHVSSRKFDKSHDIFYAIFNTPENSAPASAVCAFSMKQVIKTFKGRFKGQKSAGHNWLPVSKDETPNPHPEACQQNSKRIDDETLNFIKSHPLMNDAVPSLGDQPILVYTGFNYRFTRVAVHPQYQAVDGRKYDILFIGTNDGHVLKVVNIDQGKKVRSIVIEEIKVFHHGAKVEGLEVYHNFGMEKLVIVSSDDIVSIPLHRCHEKKSCKECVALQDPYCSWLDGKCSAFTSQGEISQIQDIRYGFHARCEEEEINVYHLGSLPNMNKSDRQMPTTATTTTTTITTTTTPVPKTTSKYFARCPPCKPCITPDPKIHVRRPDAKFPWATQPSDDHRPIESRNHLTTAEFIPTPIFIGSLVFVFLLASGLGFIVGFKVSTCKDSQDNDSTIDDATANLRVHQENDHYYAKPDNRAPTKYNNYWDGSPRAGKVPNNGSEFRPVNTYTNVKGKTYL
ncbi:semaphorin-1A isoform X3 [Octopus sinensis]|uniref:Semaphorin-1A isoform X3 n=1 Tax=Octopus sinensis TaxID=2607531 RepID=A0A6P7S4I3_9MOLL|nr:semaphorin-1A isoform X3 [Octopus sinensis]